MNSMLGEWLNRIGIILNFLAGFLLAPELIGVQRLQKIECKIEEKIYHLEKKLRPIQYYQEMSKDDDSETFWIKLMLVSSSFIPALFVVTLIALPLLLVFAGIFSYKALSGIENISVLKVSLYCFGSSALFVIVLLLVAFLFLMGQNSKENKFLKRLAAGMKQLHIMGFGTLLVINLSYLYSLLKILVKKFNEQSALQSFLVWLGIVFFVFGNLLQLIASFL